MRCVGENRFVTGQVEVGKRERAGARERGMSKRQRRAGKLDREREERGEKKRSRKRARQRRWRPVERDRPKGRWARISRSDFTCRILGKRTKIPHVPDFLSENRRKGKYRCRAVRVLRIEERIAEILVALRRSRIFGSRSWELGSFLPLPKPRPLSAKARDSPLPNLWVRMVHTGPECLATALKSR